MKRNLRARWALATALAVVATLLPMTAIGAAADEPAAALPSVWPTPHEITAVDGAVTIPAEVGLVVGADTDPFALAQLEDLLNDAGAATLTTVDEADPLPTTDLIVYVGGPTENAASAIALAALAVTGPEALVRGGYVLAAGQIGSVDSIVLSGADIDGTFYAVQTLRQLIVDGSPATVHNVTVRDWPATSLRGVLEGFYGVPWTHEQRIRQMEFLGRTKQNSFGYSPKDDAYLREEWRDPYPPAELSAITDLVESATANHVQFKYTLSPGLSVCFSSDSDYQALEDKFQSMWDIGVRAFSVQLDDISYTDWNCAADSTMFGTGEAAAASAQAHLLNRVQAEFIDTHPGAEVLTMAPTEYYDVVDTPYKTTLRNEMSPGILVYWTGVGIVPRFITTAETAAANTVFGNPILLADNYPVNDYVPNKLQFGAYAGREPGIVSHLAGLVSNPMNQSEASKVAEFTSGDFAWNPEAYDENASWLAGLKDLGGDGWQALKLLAENNYSSELNLDESVPLRALITAFRTARSSGADSSPAAADLIAYFQAMVDAPAALAATGNPILLDEIGPWLDKFALQGRVGLQSMDVLAALAANDGVTAWGNRRALVADLAALDAMPQQVAVGVLDDFITNIDEEFNRWAGVTSRTPVGISSMPFYPGPIGGTWPLSNMLDGDPATAYSSNRAYHVGDYVGVDLGSIRSLTGVTVSLGSVDYPGDTIAAGVLEYSAEGTAWTPIGSFSGTPTVTATLPEAVEARYVRFRSTTSGAWVKVSEITVVASPPTTFTVTGVPGAASGSAAGNIVDGKVGTDFVAASVPSSGDNLTVAISPTKALDQLIILHSGVVAAGTAVQVHTADGWSSIGSLSTATFKGAGFTQLDAGGAIVDAVRILWPAGVVAPRIAEVLPWFVRSTPVAMGITPDAVTLVAGGDAATATVTLSSARAIAVGGSIAATAPTGVSATLSSGTVVVPRGSSATVQVTLSAAATAAPGNNIVIPVTFTPDSGDPVTANVVVRVVSSIVPMTSMGTYPGWPLDNMLDGDLGTAWSNDASVPEGAWFGVDVGSVRSVAGVNIVMGSTNFVDDYMPNAELEYSVDGTVWTPVDTYVGVRTIDKTFADPIDARYIRVRALAATTMWMKVSEFGVTFAAVVEPPAECGAPGSNGIDPATSLPCPTTGGPGEGGGGSGGAGPSTGGGVLAAGPGGVLKDLATAGVSGVGFSLLMALLFIAAGLSALGAAEMRRRAMRIAVEPRRLRGLS